jgi:hypothetical protein
LTAYSIRPNFSKNWQNRQSKPIVESVSCVFSVPYGRPNPSLSAITLLILKSRPWALKLRIDPLISLEEETRASKERIRQEGRGVTVSDRDDRRCHESSVCAVCAARFDRREHELLWICLEKFGRPLEFYTDKASLFRTTEKRRRDRVWKGRD